jgi:hypothetical protein
MDNVNARVFKQSMILKSKRLITLSAFCAVEEIRTPKSFRTLPPQSSASTNFATTALGVQK